MNTCTKPTPNPRGIRPLEGVGFRMGWLAHAIPTGVKSNHGKGVSGRGEPQPSPLIPDHVGLALAKPTAYRNRIPREERSQLGAVPPPLPAPACVKDKDQGRKYGT